MFKFGKSRDPGDSANRIPEMLAVPQTGDLQFILSKAQRNWRAAVELPFRTSSCKVSFTISVKCEVGTGSPSWTLFRTDVPGTPAIWTHQSNDVLLIHNLLDLEYEAAKKKSEEVAGQDANELASASGHATTNSAASEVIAEKLSTNPYLARLQESGRYGDYQNAANTEKQPGHQSEEAPATEGLNVTPDWPAVKSPIEQQDWTRGYAETQVERAPYEIDWPDTSLHGSNMADDTLPVSQGKKWINTGEQERVDWSGMGNTKRPADPGKLSKEIKVTRLSVEATLSRADTGIFTYAAFNYFFDIECVRFNRGGLAFSIMIFKLVDKAGANISVATIRKVAERLRAIKRQLDLLAHFEETSYVFLLPHTDSAGALAFAERIQQLLLDYMAESQSEWGSTTSLFFSFGIASMPEHGTRPEDLLMAAHRAVRK